MNLNPQAIKILEILEDGGKHCPIEWRYADGHGKRFTDINRYLAPMGKTLNWAWCDCGRHVAKIKMRWIEDIGEIASKPAQIKEFGQNTTLSTKSLESPVLPLNPLPAQKALFSYSGTYQD